ncbi:uncharacterized protein LOC127901724 [Citrus sinensis]|uniref:uncharacterized protein LOC127901724 n=1 Tax=Citrus sinensis TaxID=2711 RepID=UPI002279BEF3|nr:uncharacterized protein LOC127901724 [Citrus sinensis]
MAGGDKSKGKHVAKKRKDDHGDYSDFMLIHFPRLQLRKIFLDHFKPRTLLTKVDSLSERQDQLQSMLEAFQLQSISERESLFAQQQQLLDGQQQLFVALGFPPPSSSSHPPSP